MGFQISISGFVALYIFMLAAFAGWVIIGRVPAILHTPLMSGANAIHGVILIGAILVTGSAVDLLPTILGALAVLLATINMVGGFVVTDRMLEMFRGRKPASKPVEK